MMIYFFILVGVFLFILWIMFVRGIEIFIVEGLMCDKGYCYLFNYIIFRFIDIIVFSILK